MSLIHPALIYAAGLAVIPVILHFLLRAKPKKLLFPALRLIQLRRRQNIRRMRLRHVWLLLLRMLVIVGLAIAVARPSLPEANYEFNIRELVTLGAIVAAGLGAYLGLMRLWHAQRLSHQTLAYRRTLLRGGLGAGVVTLVGLLVMLPYVNRLRAEISAPAPAVSSDLPVAAVFLFDTSLSMQYTQEGKTRLDVAKSIALEHMDSLPPRSRIAVGETTSSTPILFQADLVGAKSKIQSLAPHPIAQALNDRVRASLALQEQDQGRTLAEQQSVPQDARRDRYIREVYVFTDLAATAWRPSSATLLKQELERMPWVGVYVIDVGEASPRDVGITNVALSRQSVAEGGSLVVDATLAAVGVDDEERTVELSLVGRDGKPIKQGGQSVKVRGQQGAKVQFSLANLQGPLQHGTLKIVAADPLPMNDSRHFTVEVKPPPDVLLVSPENVGTDFRDMLAAPEDVKAGKARFHVTEFSPKKLATANLKPFSVVVLNNVPAVSEVVWKSLHKFVSGGGGLFIVLGSAAIGDAVGIESVSYNSETAKSLLPAELIAALIFKTPAALDPKNLNHPALKRLAELDGGGELASVEVQRYWKTLPYDNSNVLIPYSETNDLAALIERRVGSGRVAMLTTAADNFRWNDLPRSWAFFVLTEQLLQYLSGRNDASFNFLAGEEVTVRATGEPALQKYLLRKPSGQQLQGTVPAGANSFVISETDQLGHYSVLSADPQSPFVSGLSVNASPSESDFRRLSEDELQQLFGEKRFSLARDIASLQRRVTTGRLGEEVYPLLLLLALLVFCGEHFVANWFYSEDGEPAAA